MSTTIDPKDINGNRFLGRTRTVPRPTGAERDYAWSGGAEALRRDQQLWDDAEAWARENDAIRADRLTRLDAAKTAKRRDDDAREAAKRTAERDQLVARLRSQFLAANPGAVEADWERNRGAILDDHFRRQMDDPARADRGRYLRAV
jgi:hypothetical protein